jgi:hypothetical protein
VDLTSRPWYRFRPPGRPLRIGVLADSAGIARWLASTVASVVQLPDVEIVDWFVLPPRNSPDAPAPWLFRKFAAWSRSGAPDDFALSSDLPPQADRHELHGGPDAPLAAADRDLIRSRELDVLWCATRLPLSGNCAGLARWGVWRFLLGEPEFAVYQPPYWREVYQDRSVSRCLLLAHPERFERGCVVDSFAMPTVASLHFERNASAALQAAGPSLVRTLWKAADWGTAPCGGQELVLAAAPPRWPSSTETLAFACRGLGRSAALFARSYGRSIIWVVAIRPASGGVDYSNVAQGAPFREIAAPPGHYYADPFLVESESRHWLFVEDWVQRNGRGCLTCMEVRDDGSVGEPAVILEKPYHLSYPHVFRHGADYFMIPETCDDCTVQLYRATRFPHQWTLEAVLSQGAGLADTTPLLYDGVWYFFTSTGVPPQEAYLFTADRLDGRWRYHPANPIGSDTRNLRGAGAIAAGGGVLVRPAQDGSQGYGYAMTFNEIVRLSPTEFQERPVGKLLPTWAPGLSATHTFNSDSRYEVVDGLKAMIRRKS